MTTDERGRFLCGGIVVEEKVDGANIGISVGPDGQLRVQNRGGYIGAGAHPQFGQLWVWLGLHSAAISRALGKNLTLFGEWCFAVHSVYYDRLPDWFLGFDVLEHATGQFWSVEHRDALLRSLQLSSVPTIARRTFSLDALRSLTERRSAVGSGSAEGIYLRHEKGAWNAKRAKLVRPHFVQTMGEHWSRRALRANRLCGESAVQAPG